MKKYIVNYIFVCLVILIVTSLLYIVNNDKKEYMDHGDNNMSEIQYNVLTNINETLSYVQDNRKDSVDNIYDNYWNYISIDSSGSINKLDGCGSRFVSFMNDIKDRVDQQFQDSDLCKNFTYDEYTTLDLSDYGRSRRIKAKCLDDALESNEKGLNQLVIDYKAQTTPLERCEHLKNNGY